MTPRGSHSVENGSGKVSQNESQSSVLQLIMLTVRPILMLAAAPNKEKSDAGRRLVYFGPPSSVYCWALN